MTELYDRLTGERPRHLPPRVLAGQLHVMGDGRIDGRRPGADGSLLMDGGDGATSIEVAGRHETTTVLQGARTTTLESVGEVADMAQGWLDQGFDWWEVVAEVSPVASRQQVGGHLEPTPLEAAVSHHLPELYEVFARPFKELRLQSRRLPVSRARRVSRHATQKLSAHSEDWLRLDAAGVVPRVIESMVREEVVDVYENRVAARLLDAIARHLLQTLARVDDADDLVRHEVVGWWRQQARITQLWGSQPDDDALERRITERRAAIAQLLGRVLSLRNAPLYDGVPVQARVSWPIRVTNLLAQDQNYRAVSTVWAEWWRGRSNETPGERRSRRQRQANAFAAFCHVILARGIAALATTDAPGARNSVIPETDEHHVPTPWGSLGLVPVDPPTDGSWDLVIAPALGTERRCRVVALPAELLTGDEVSIADRLRLLHDHLEGHDPILVLYPGTGRHVRALSSEVAHLAHHQGLDGRNGRWVIPVSPLDLESSERLGRAIRWHLFEALYGAYPAAVPFPNAHHSLLTEARGWLKEGPDRNTVRVVGLAPPRQLDALVRRIDDEARRLERRFAGQGRLDAERLDIAAQQLAATAAATSALAVCPVCHTPRQFLAGDAGTFRADCHRCARWGLWHDPRTGHRVPYLFPHDPGLDGPAPIADQVDLARRYGQDLLANPCAHRDSELGDDLINPYTGICTKAPSYDLVRCARCVERSDSTC